jgi:hypothetical protein
MPLFRIHRQKDGMAVLIMAAADTDIRRACMFDLVEARHP